MCGLVGIYRKKIENQGNWEIQKEYISKMNDSLSHRGMDDSSIYFDNRLAVGHRRLSIIDIINGSQPLLSKNKELLIVFNGEIFNYVELKNELIKQGEYFNTESDTEVLLKIYEKYGIEGFEKLNGQFAFCIYNLVTSTIIISRDLNGEKPFYFFENESYFVFGSEVKSIIEFLKLNKIEYTINKNSLFDYFSFNYVPIGDTLISGIKNLTPGCIYIIENNLRKEYKINIKKNLNFDGNNTKYKYDNSSFTGITRNFEETLKNSIKLRIRSDVPIGMFLSSGKDSATIATILGNLQVPVTAVTAKFIDSSFDESEYAEQIAIHTKIKFKKVLIDLSKEDFPKIIEEIVDKSDTPLADSSCLPFYLICREAKKLGLKVILTGDGADEILGGYITFKATQLSNKIPKLFRYLLFKLWKSGLWGNYSSKFISNEKVSLHEKIDRFMRAMNLSSKAAHLAWNGSLTHYDKLKILNKDYFDIEFNTDSYNKISELLSNSLDITSKSFSYRDTLNADRNNYLVYDILEKADRMSMAHGIEVRPVYTDMNIINFTEQIHIKFLKNKYLLTNFLNRKLPWYNTKMKKKGFSIPIHRYFREEIKEFYMDLILSESTKTQPYFNHKSLVEFSELHMNKKRNLGYEMWGIMIFLLWNRKFLLNN